MLYDDIEFIDFRNKHSIVCRRQRYLTKNPHWHAYYEIELVVDAEGEHMINGHKYRQTTGDIFLMRLTDFHEFKMERESEQWVIEIPPAVIPDEISNLLLLADGDIITHLEPDDFNKAKELFYMIEESNNKSDAFHEMQKTYLTCSLILFILDKMKRNISEKCSRSNVQIREIIAYIHDNLFIDLSVSNIAAQFYISKEYLCTFFKKNTGITLVSYIRKARLSYAAKLIVTSNKKIIEISELSGFNAMSTFMRDFKKEFGMSPTEMRQNYIKEKRED